MPPQSSISVVVIVRNMKKTIRRTLYSVLNAQPDEIIVVDGQSTDGTSKIIDEFPVVHVYDSGKGPAVARNIGLKLSRGEYVAMVDGDEYVPHNFIQIIRENISKHGYFDLLIGEHKFIIQGFWGRCLTVERKHVMPFILASLARISSLVRRASFYKEGLSFYEMDPRVFRKAVIKEIGGYNENLSTFEHPYDIYWRMLEKFGNDLLIIKDNRLQIYGDETDVSPLNEFKRGVFYGRGLAPFFRVHRLRALLQIMSLPPFEFIYLPIILISSIIISRSFKIALGIIALRLARSIGYLHGLIKKSCEH